MTDSRWIAEVAVTKTDVPNESSRLLAWQRIVGTDAECEDVITPTNQQVYQGDLGYWWQLDMGTNKNWLLQAHLVSIDQDVSLTVSLNKTGFTILKKELTPIG